MPANPFDQFDPPPAGNPFDRFDEKKPAGNVFDQFDERKPNSFPRRLVDLGVSLAKGVPQVGQTAYQLADVVLGGNLDRASTALTGAVANAATSVGDAITGNRVGAGSLPEFFGDKGAPVTPRADQGGEKLSAGFQQLDDAISSGYSADQQAANQRVADAKGFVPTVVESLKNPSTIVNNAVESLPVSLGMMGGIRALAMRAGTAAAEAATAKGLTAAEVAAARNEAIDTFSTGKAGVAAQMGTDFLTSGAQQAADAKAAIENIPDDELATSPAFQQLIKTMSPEQAREKLASNGQFKAFLTAGVLSAATSPISAGLEGKAATAGLRDQAAQKAARAFLGIKQTGKDVAKSVGTEALQETLQSGGEQVGTNVGMTEVDPNYDLTKDVGAQAAAGGLSGGLMGGAFHLAGHADDIAHTAEGVRIDPAAGPLSAAAAAHIKAGNEPALALPGPTTTFPGGPMIAGADGVVRPATYADMTNSALAAGRDADGLSNSRAVTDNHLQHAQDLGLTYTLAEAQQIAQIHAAKTNTPMSVMPTPNGQYTAIPTSWVAAQYLDEHKDIQPAASRAALPNPDRPTGKLVGDAAGNVRAGTDRDEQPGRLAMRDARAARDVAQEQEATDLASGNTADVRAANQRRLGETIARWRADRDSANLPNASSNDSANLPNARSVVDAAESTTAPIDSDVLTALDRAAHEAATSPQNDRPEPTQAQKEAGNYALGHFLLHGLDLSIENPVGSTRTSKPGAAQTWSRTMEHHYGYIRGTVGKDGDHIDAFVGRNPESTRVFVVDQSDPARGRFDEHKVMLGFNTADEAREAYLGAHEKGWKGLQALTETNVGDFKKWLANGATKSPFAMQARMTKGALKSIEAISHSTKPKSVRVVKNDSANLPNAPVPKVMKAASKQPALFARGATPDRQSGPGVHIGVDRTQAVVDRLLGQWRNAPDGLAVASFDNLPRAAREDAAKQGADPAGVLGVFHDGKFYLIADAHASERDIEATLFHEVWGHFGTRTLFADANKSLGAVFDRMGSIEGLTALADKNDIDLRHYVRGLVAANKADPKRYTEALVKRALVEELIAHVAEKGTPSFGQRIKEIIGAIRAWLRASGFARLAAFNDQDLARLVGQARDAVRFGREGNAVVGDPSSFRIDEEGTPAESKVLDPSVKDGEASKRRAMASTVGGRPAGVNDTRSRFDDAAKADIERPGIVKTLTQKVSDTFASPATVSLWSRTVGTMYHAAQTIPAFKPVFDLGQRFLQDTSQIAMNAADLAPNILPKLGTLRDVLRPGLGKKDADAVAKAFFQGTREGERFDDATLASRFSLSPDQIGVFHEARAAVDRMLDETLASEVARVTRKAVDAETLAAIKATPGDAARIALEALGMTRPELSASIHEKAENIAKLKAEGYAPLSRFGQHTVYAVDKDGRQLYYDMRESAASAAALARMLKANFPDAIVTQGILSSDAYKSFQGTNPDTLELFAQAMGVDADEAFQTYIAKAVNNRSTLKRLAHRRTGADGLSGLEGFSEDLPRVLASFVTSGARMAAKNYSMLDMLEAVQAIPKENGDVVDMASKLHAYLLNPQEEAPALRGYLFTHFIGGSIASALTNMTQPILQTFPYLSQWGTARAAKELAEASRIAATNGKVDPSMAAALARAERDGVLAPHELHQLYSESIRGFGSNVVLRKGLKVWGSLFSLAEAFNRKATFIAAYRIGATLDAGALQKAGVADAFAFAEKAIHETQGIYNRGNRPMWARGAIGATLFTFKQFSVSYLEFLKRLPRKQQALALAILVMAAGTQGLPFAEDLEDIIDTIGQSLGYDTNSKQALRNTAAAILGENFGQFIMSGASSLPGVPLDVQGRLGLANLIPGTALFKPSQKDKLKEAFEAIGPVGSFVVALTSGVTEAQAGDLAGVARGVLPVALQNAMKALDMETTGAYRDGHGRVVTKTTDLDAVMKGLGFQPQDVARAQLRLSGVYQDRSLNDVVRGQITQQWANGMFENDPGKIRDAVDALRTWNVKNPDSPIQITPASLVAKVRDMALTADARTIKGTPKGLRGHVAAALQ